MRSLLCPLLLSGCVATQPASWCTTVSSDRISPSEPLPELGGASVNDWFDEYETELSWSIEWSGADSAPTTDRLTLTLERRGRPTLEEERPTRPETPDTPDELAGRCMTGLFIRTAVRATVTTDSGIQQTADGELVMAGPELDSAWLEWSASGPVPEAFLPEAGEASCPVTTNSRIAMDRESSLSSPSGSVGTASATCVEEWAQWKAAEGR